MSRRIKNKKKIIIGIALLALIFCMALLMIEPKEEFVSAIQTHSCFFKAQAKSLVPAFRNHSFLLLLLLGVCYLGFHILQRTRAAAKIQSITFRSPFADGFSLPLLQ